MRAVHRLVRRIQQLRARKPGRTTIPLSNGQKSETMVGLSGELEAVEQQLALQRDCCGEMQATVVRMEERLPGLKTVAERLGHLDPPSE
jgi:hypothetical protein